MRVSNLRLFVSSAALLVIGFVPAVSQQMQQSDIAAMHTIQQPFAIETFGVFRNMMLSGDFSPKVQIGAAMEKHPTTGVGAVADARGEITIYDGKLIVSYGDQRAAVDSTSDAAALLAMGSASEWQIVPVEGDVAPADIESCIAAAATAHGLDPDKAFPFEIRGSIGPYIMHVNAEPTGGPHAMGLPMAIAVESRGDRIDSFVAGLYVSPALMGVATHGGERTHAHWISPDLTSTAHLDRWGVKAGALLLLPK